MAFESVDVTSLRNSINSCKASLNHSASQNLITSLSSNIWQTQAKQVLVNALTKLNEERYKKLEDTLDTYLGIADKIEAYKNLEQSNINLRNRNSWLQGRIYRTEYYTEYYDDTYKDQFGYWHTVERSRTASRQVRDESVVNEINNNITTINNNMEKMRKLQNEVANLI